MVWVSRTMAGPGVIWNEKKVSEIGLSQTVIQRPLKAPFT